MSKVILSLVLSSLLKLLLRASEKYPEYRAGLSKDVTILLNTKNCGPVYFGVVGRKFIADDRPRDADLVLSFDKAGTALKFLLSRDPLSKLIDGMTAGEISLAGNIMLLLWFQGRISQAMPFSSLRKHETRLPGSTIGPPKYTNVSREIERLGVKEEIDPSWHAAIGARDEVLMWKVSHGEMAPRF